MNDHIHAAKFMLEDGMTPSEIGYRLNDTPMSALTGSDGRKYGYPKKVFVNLVGGIRTSPMGRVCFRWTSLAPSRRNAG